MPSKAPRSVTAHRLYRALREHEFNAARVEGDVDGASSVTVRLDAADATRLADILTEANQ